MELSKPIVDALNIGHSSGNIDDVTFSNIITFIFHSLTAAFPDKSTENKHFQDLFGISWEQFQQNQPSITQKPSLQLYTALLTTLLEAARFDISANELKTVLDDKLDENRVQEVLDAYKKNLTQTRFQLALHSVNFSQLIDFSWRLDYNVHSNVLEDMREQTYILTFVVLDKNTDQPREISCQADLAQMNELLAQIKNAIAKKV